MGLFFTWATMCFGCAVAFTRPYLGLLCFVCLGLVSPRTLWHWSVPDFPFSKVLGFAVIFGWALAGFGSWNVGKARWIAVSLVAFLFWAVACATTARHPDVAWEFVLSILKIVIPVIIGITLVDSTAKLRSLAWLIVLTVGYVAFEFNISYFQGTRMVYNTRWGGMEEGSISVVMATGAGFALMLGLAEPVWWRKLVALLASALMAHVVMFAISRGGMLGLCAAAACAIWLVPKRKSHLLALACSLLVGFALAGPSVTAEFNTIFAESEDRDESAQSRLDLWIDQYDVTLKSPIFGVGPNNWPLIAEEYGWPPGKEGHGLWPQIAAEMGFPGVLFLASFYGCCVWQLMPLARGRVTTEDPWLADGARMVLPSLAAFIVSASFISLEGIELPYYVAMFGAGVLKLSFDTHHPLTALDEEVAELPETVDDQHLVLTHD